MHTNVKTYKPFIGQFDPCPPITEKSFSTPPHLYLGFQPPNLPQFSAKEALKRGTLWKVFNDPYYGPSEQRGE